MNHRAAERPDPLQCRTEVSDGEVGQRHRVAGTGPTLMHAHRRRVRMCLPSASLFARAALELSSEQARPELPCSFWVIRWKLDEGEPQLHRWHDSRHWGRSDASVRRHDGGGDASAGQRSRLSFAPGRRCGTLAWVEAELTDGSRSTRPGRLRRRRRRRTMRREGSLKRSRGWQHRGGRDWGGRSSQPTLPSGPFHDSAHGTADSCFGGRCLPRRG
jgi:hypothetical protein